MKKTQFVIYPELSKCRYYNDLSEIVSDFSENEICNATIQVLYNSVVVGTLNTHNVLSEIYNDVDLLKKYQV